MEILTIELGAGVIFILGLLTIILGAEMILRGSSYVATILGVKPMIIGLTIVSLGTSAPELAVGLTAVSEGKSDLAVGNIAGTNMLNLLFILGLSAAIKPLKLQTLSIRLDVPVMMAAAIVLFIMSLDGTLTRTEGILLLLGGIAYVFALIHFSRKASPGQKKEYAEEFGKNTIKGKISVGRIILYSLILLGGIALAIIGAEWLVDGAVDIAESMGVSDAIIGLTIVAIGTSAPELVTTIIATIKDDRDVAVGNLIGSSISNIVIILGIICIVATNGVTVSSAILWLDLPLAAAVAIVCYPVFKTDKTVSRKEGIAFVSAYMVYMLTLIFLRT